MKIKISTLLVSALILNATSSKASEDPAWPESHGKRLVLTKEMLGHDISREPETDFQTNKAYMMHQASDYLWLERVISDFAQTPSVASKKPFIRESSIFQSKKAFMIEQIDSLRQEIKTMIRQRFDSVDRVIKHTRESMFYFDNRLMEQEKEANLSRTMLRRRLMAIDDCIADLRDSNKAIQESVRNLFTETAHIRSNFFDLSHRIRMLETKMEEKR